MVDSHVSTWHTVPDHFSLVNLHSTVLSSRGIAIRFWEENVIYLINGLELGTDAKKKEEEKNDEGLC